MFKEGIGVIYDLKFENFLPGGFGYIKERKTFKKNNFSSFLKKGKMIENRINLNFAFTEKIREIDEQIKENEKNGNLDYLNKKTTAFFEEESENDSVLDIVILPKTPLFGFEKEATSLYSIIYFELKDNLKLGFLVDKNLIQLLTTGKIIKGDWIYNQTKNSEEPENNNKDSGSNETKNEKTNEE